MNQPVGCPCQQFSGKFSRCLWEYETESRNPTTCSRNDQEPESKRHPIARFTPSRKEGKPPGNTPPRNACLQKQVDPRRGKMNRETISTPQNKLHSLLGTTTHVNRDLAKRRHRIMDIMFIRRSRFEAHAGRAKRPRDQSVKSDQRISSPGVERGSSNSTISSVHKIPDLVQRRIHLFIHGLEPAHSTTRSGTCTRREIPAILLVYGCGDILSQSGATAI